MKKTVIYISILITLSSSLSCNNEQNKDLEEIDSKNTIELINKILNGENSFFLSSSCITEKPEAISSPMVLNKDSYIKDLIKIKDTAHYDMQSKFYNNFEITADLFPNKKIITEKQFKELQRKAEKGEIRFFEWLDNNCDKGYCSIAKPIFNETYDLAVVQLGYTCGGLCGSGATLIYENIDGNWKEKEIISLWES